MRAVRELFDSAIDSVAWLVEELGIKVKARLLVALVDQGAAGLRARYVVLVRGDKVIAEGECAPRELPFMPEARAAFFSRSGYFERTEMEARTLPFLVRRHVTASLAFSDAFKARFAHEVVADGRYRVDLAAVGAEELQDVSTALPSATLPFTRLAMVETAIAALVGMVTPEPAAILWLRNGVLAGLLVQRGHVLSRTLDRTAQGEEEDLAPRLERVDIALAAAWRREFPHTEPGLGLALGELAGKGWWLPGMTGEAEDIEHALTRRFPGAAENAVLEWPEAFGLAAVPACYSLLEKDYQEEAEVSRYATLGGRALLACAALALLVSFFKLASWRSAASDFETQNAALAAEYAALQKQLPSDDQIEALRKLYGQGGAGFRMDAFLVWLSHATPDGVVIRHLGVQGSGKDNATLSMRVEWEVTGDYGQAERLTGELLARLGKRTKLGKSQLEHQPGARARFTAELTPQDGAFKG